MCLFTSAGEEIDFPWLHEVILVLPEGPESDPETELILSGLVRSKKENSKLIFVHRGEIYALTDRSSEWLSINTKPDDWLTNNLINHQYKKIELARRGKYNRGKYNIRPRRSDLAIPAAVSPGQGMLSNIEVYCSDKTYEHKQDDMPKEPRFSSNNPILSSFSVTFPSKEMLLFRVSFRTRFGLRDYHSQIAFDVQGSDLAMDSISKDITDQVSDVSRKKELWQKVGDLYNSAKRPQYEVAIVSHPSIALTIEHMENTLKLADFSMETKDTAIKSVASPARVMCFDINRKDVLVQAVAGIVKGPGYHSYSQEFLDGMEGLK